MIAISIHVHKHHLADDVTIMLFQKHIETIVEKSVDSEAVQCGLAHNPNYNMYPL
jgi:hypothetical protein